MLSVVVVLLTYTHEAMWNRVRYRDADAIENYLWSRVLFTYWKLILCFWCAELYMMRF